MPTYEFRCPKGHEFERFYRTISAAEAELPCPECGAIAQRKISGGAGFAFKGSGFYLTDYGKNAHRGTAKPGSAKDGSAKDGNAKEGSSNDGSSKVASEGGTPKAESPKPPAESSKPQAETRKPQAETRKPKAE
jgi:putative FmdB family regulatory protein